MHMNNDRPNYPVIDAAHAVESLKKHILVDGFQLVVDLERSRGSRFVDAPTNRTLIDLYSFYASMPLGFNHPYFDRPEVQRDLLIAARTKVANSDVYSTQYANFVETFARVVGTPALTRYFFIEGGALAVENCLKAAMDWKVQKNLAAGRGERGTEILHFEKAFHGRSGYTMSLTNTDPQKVKYFAKFDWPRVPAPAIDFSLPEPQRTTVVAELERRVEQQIRDICKAKAHDIAAIIIEPIQGEGGDRHFRGEFFAALRRICDEFDLLLIFDEVQCGMGLTGRNWCWEHFGVAPDLMSFGKKAQVCGVMAGPRLNEVEGNVFRVPSRINSTWGGNLTDMVRSMHVLRVIEQERLVDHARTMGEQFQARLHEVARDFPIITAVRGRGLMMAFDLPSKEPRDGLWKACYESGLLVVRCGERSIRMRPVLDVAPDVIDDAIRLLREGCKRAMTPR